MHTHSRLHIVYTRSSSHSRSHHRYSLYPVAHGIVNKTSCFHPPTPPKSSLGAGPCAAVVRTQGTADDTLLLVRMQLAPSERPHYCPASQEKLSTEILSLDALLLDCGVASPDRGPAFAVSCIPILAFHLPLGYIMIFTSLI